MRPVRLPDLVSDSKLTAQLFPGYVEHTLFVSDAGVRRQERKERWRRASPTARGHGAAGAVWLETCLTTPGKLRGVKEISKSPHSPTSFEYSRELETIAKFSQQKVLFCAPSYTPSTAYSSQYNGCFVQSYGWFEDANTIFLTMEYFPLGDLQRYLTRPLPESEAQQITFQILEGVRFMHESHYAHRDLKPAVSSLAWFERL